MRTFSEFVEKFFCFPRKHLIFPISLYWSTLVKVRRTLTHFQSVRLNCLLNWHWQRPCFPTRGLRLSAHSSSHWQISPVYGRELVVEKDLFELVFIAVIAPLSTGEFTIEGAADPENTIVAKAKEWANLHMLFVYPILQIGDVANQSQSHC